jgi:hypothetical protein
MGLDGFLASKGISSASDFAVSAAGKYPKRDDTPRDPDSMCPLISREEIEKRYSRQFPLLYRLKLRIIKKCLN